MKAKRPASRRRPPSAYGITKGSCPGAARIPAPPYSARMSLIGHSLAQCQRRVRRARAERAGQHQARLQAVARADPRCKDHQGFDRLDPERCHVDRDARPEVHLERGQLGGEQKKCEGRDASSVSHGDQSDSTAMLAEQPLQLGAGERDRRVGLGQGRSSVRNPWTMPSKRF